MPTPQPLEARSPALQGVLRELGSRVRRGAGDAALEATGAPARFATGIAALDRPLGGGLPCGRLTEVSGPGGSGRTSLALALLARATARGELAALVDVADALDPASAAAAGVALARVLWVRAPDAQAALQAAEQALATQGIPLVLVDALRETPAPQALTRLRKAASAAHAVLVVLSDVRRTGAFSDLALDLGRVRPRFTGTPPLLEGLEGTMHVSRNRIGPTFEPVSVQWPTPRSQPRRIETPRRSRPAA